MPLRDTEDPLSIITPIENGVRFPEILDMLFTKYDEDIELFRTLVLESKSSGELLKTIRSPKIPASQRMSLLKMFRRCVSLVCDTETTKKITKITSESLIDAYGQTFKPIAKIQAQFKNLNTDTKSALAALIGEYDTRGQQGYQLTEMFFDWFEETFPDLDIIGPRGAGRDIELNSVIPEFTGNYPCDFVIKDGDTILAVGFARYDSTRGGAQSDDRTGGNSNKVEKARIFEIQTGHGFKLIFVSDGPGLAHKDTWEEACVLDEMWDNNVKVVTLKTAPEILTKDWLTS